MPVRAADQVPRHDEAGVDAFALDGQVGAVPAAALAPTSRADTDDHVLYLLDGAEGNNRQLVQRQKG